jgi:hypothetical protein
MIHMDEARLITIAGVSERDIDLLLLEEFVALKQFREWFVSKVGLPEAVGGELVEAKRSVTHSTGESDLEITLLGLTGKRYRLLIENKMTAGFQPNQAERYRERGGSYIKNSEIDQYKTVLIAPRIYFQDDLRGFDARIDYEALYEWFETNHSIGERVRYKTSIIRSAIEKGITGYQFIPNDPVTKFWSAYWTLLQKIAPELDMEEPGNKPAGATFIYFRGIDLPSGVTLCHKLTHGHVDLQFADMGEKLSELKARFSDILANGMRISKAAKSAVVRIDVSPVSVAKEFEPQKEGVIEGIKAARELLGWYKKILS